MGVTNPTDEDLIEAAGITEAQYRRATQAAVAALDQGTEEFSLMDRGVTNDEYFQYTEVELAFIEARADRVPVPSRIMDQIRPSLRDL